MPVLGRSPRRSAPFLVFALLLLSALLLPGLASATTFYVRTDGGTAAQCTGKADAAYSGSGSNQACAWKHPYYALPPNQAARMAGGDTLIIGPGEYMIGWGAPGSADVSGRCYNGGRYDCYLPAIPNGTASSKTRILGAGYNTGCAAPPKLWGTERVTYLINLENSSNVEVGCLELTDKSDCVESHSNSSAVCNRDTSPYGNWAASGIYARNSKNVHLHDLNIHGLANRGIIAGGLTDWLLERVKIVANGWAGWDGDIGSSSSNSGQIVMRNVEIAWNGCGERWQTGEPWACWAQEGSGYGDGLGTAKTGGQWVIEDSYVHHNTSDGIDLLYLDGATTTSATIRRVKAEGNAGNQLKVNGTSLIENSVVVGDCSYFNGKYLMRDGDQCRALGNTLSVGLAAGQPAIIRHNTITGEGDCLILTGGGSSASSVLIQNNALIGAVDWRSNKQGNTGELTCGHYADNSSAKVTFSGNLFWNVKSSQCPSGSPTSNICGKNPSITDTRFASFNAIPLAGSPLVDAVPVLTEVAVDYFGNARPYGVRPDIGAIELGGATVAPGRVMGGVMPPLLISGTTAGAGAMVLGSASPSSPALVVSDSGTGTVTSGSGSSVGSIIADAVASGWQSVNAGLRRGARIIAQRYRNGIADARLAHRLRNGFASAAALPGRLSDTLRDFWADEDEAEDSAVQVAAGSAGARAAEPVDGNTGAVNADAGTVSEPDKQGIRAGQAALPPSATRREASLDRTATL